MAARANKGFTLVEVLIAAVIIAGIFSVVYGTYFAISSGIERVRAEQKLAQNAQDTLSLIARQIRCCYAEKNIETEDDDSTVKEENKDEDEIEYFNGSSGRHGRVLRFITTNSLTKSSPEKSEGLYDVTYSLDRNSGVLYASQKSFSGQMKRTGKNDWVQIADNIRSFKLTYFDGRTWTDKWFYKDTKRLPNAVRIRMQCVNKTGRTFAGSAVVNINCLDFSETETKTDKKTAANIR